jgi:addiction module toxin, relE/stbE family
MAKFKLKYSKRFLKDYKKLSVKDKDLTDAILTKLLNGEPLEAKHKDHALKGKLIGLRDCHIKPDLVLIYKPEEQILILTAVRIANHSNAF